MNNSNKIPWYAAGLHFECLQCGRCCSGPTGGYIWVSRHEIQLLAHHLNMPVKELKQKFLKRVSLRITIVEDPRTNDCIFLRKSAQGNTCVIYPVRPAQCRNWPFWHTNLAGPYTWNLAGNKCPGINRGKPFTAEQIQAKKNNKKWWLEKKDVPYDRNEIIRRVSDIYNWLDEQLNGKSACDTSREGRQTACGKCCDFNAFGHRLFVTSPEMIYFIDKIGQNNIKQMTTGKCPWQVDAKCSVYPHRFAGCRIFSCKSDAAFQSELTESTIKNFKSLCDEFEIPYRYVDLPVALSNFKSVESV